MQTPTLGIFRFLDLPIVIRLVIYEKYFEGSQILIQGRRQERGPTFQRWEQRVNHYWEVLHESAEAIEYVNTKKLPYSLSQTSSRIRAQSRPILAAATHLYILGSEIPLVLYGVPAYFRSQIKHLTVLTAGFRDSWPCFRLQVLEPADLPGLKTLTMHYDTDSAYGTGLLFPLKPGFDRLKHFSKFRADPLHREKFICRMSYLGVPFNPLARLSQVAPFHVKVQIHTPRPSLSPFREGNRLWEYSCLVRSFMNVYSRWLAFTDFWSQLIVYDMKVEEITQISVGRRSHTNMWPRAAQGEIEHDHETIL